MMGIFTVSGANTTIDFTYTQPMAKEQAIVGMAVHYPWDVGYGDHGTLAAPILFSSLTNQQKLDLVDAYVKQVIMDAATNFNANAAARDAAIAMKSLMEANVILADALIKEKIISADLEKRPANLEAAIRAQKYRIITKVNPGNTARIDSMTIERSLSVEMETK